MTWTWSLVLQVAAIWEYTRLAERGAPPTVLQEIAWVTYLGNVYKEEIR